MTSDKNTQLKFPKGFLWGTATAGHQVEGKNIHSDWWAWEKSRKDIENSGIACDHYHLYKKDFSLIKEVLHNNAYRFSIEWARIEPKEGKFNKKEVEHYRNVLNELSRLRIKSMVTLHHFVNPLWFSEKGGWEKKENIKYFERFVNLCIKEFGQDIDYWIVVNEPNIYISMAYIKGGWPPGKKSLLTAIKVYCNLAHAHKSAYKLIHDTFPNAKVSSAIHMSAFKYMNIFDKPLSDLSNYLFSYSFIFLTKGYHDFIGVNYYALHLTKFSDIFYKSIKVEEYEKLVKGKVNDLGWPIYPKGIYEVTRQVWKRYKLPIIITENGTADAHEPNRIKFLVNHIKWLQSAIKDGVDIRGYFYWSLMDNFEWHLGKGVRFGLFETDYRTLKRIPRKSAEVFGKIAQTNSIPTNL
ncbi:MAG: Beta-glucosidase [Microgenomates group bacterium GW2011_GWC1_37_8]|uniref:Beta-glucosidase n=1 Tax=Candidatus Woesebacteria bacterium GW2011_GWB1_38_8 TaxID=1618570 RepID=A0A0G0LAT9_9BACT|nr:MAG: Beta-glucosidase [Microgenomates group bacterium GW2011_GWC1_37_8]KKQ84990.1 MAG: Beta-glucosidase [Candidatus Woesebacteria bacterium GW2011_GWB1_38_8]